MKENLLKTKVRRRRTWTYAKCFAVFLKGINRLLITISPRTVSLSPRIIMIDVFAANWRSDSLQLRMPPIFCLFLTAMNTGEFR